MISLKTSDWQIDNIETILFDKDGTFVDLHYFWGKMTELRAKAFVEKYSLPESAFEKICLYLGYNYSQKRMLPDGITALYSRSRIIEILQKNIRSLGLEITIKDIEDIFDDVSKNFLDNMVQYIKPIDSATDFIKKIHKKGVKLGIVTSDSVESTHIAIKHLGLESFFDVVIGRESSSFTKESGEPTKIAIDTLGATMETTLMIGDTAMDYISAQNAGLSKVILVATGQVIEDDLKNTCSNTVLSLADVIIFS